MRQFEIFEPNIPSKREGLLSKVINSKVLSMIRYGTKPKENFSKEYKVKEERKAFSLSEGSLIIEFENGISLGFDSDEEVFSIITWAESYGGQYQDNQLKEDKDLFSIDAIDKKYSTKFFADIINQTLIRYEIVKKDPCSPIYWIYPREVGLVLIFSNGSQIILSHQLTKEVYSSFTILEWRQIDKKEVYPTLYKTSRFWNHDFSNKI